MQHVHMQHVHINGSICHGPIFEFSGKGPSSKRHTDLRDTRNADQHANNRKMHERVKEYFDGIVIGVEGFSNYMCSCITCLA